MDCKNNIELKVKYKDTLINATLIYRKRKNVTIEIKPKDNIIVISPKIVSKERLEELLIQKGEWILSKLEEYKNMDDYTHAKQLKNGEKFYYLGNEYSLEIVNTEDSNSSNPKIYIKDNKLLYFTNNTDEGFIKKNLKKWYKTESEKIIIERLKNCRENSPIMMKLTPSSLKVKEQKKRWGSCTSKRAIYINSKIAMARPKSIDYILIHEFCHLVHMNHSKDFYDLVRSIMPEYKIEEEWLKKNSYKLNL